jgi:NADPH:quinone reductase-like Zn-dependent oxidoreductase
MSRLRKVLGVLLIILIAGGAYGALRLSHDAPCGPIPTLADNTPSMRAAIYTCYGSADVVKITAVAKPAAANTEVLIKVHAASVNPLDWHYLKGTPYLIRMQAGVGAPKDPRLGTDFAGTVESVGKDVTRFKAGDEVYGVADGAFAEYVTKSADGSLSLKPARITFEQAAAVPIAGITALQAVRDKAHVQPGQKVLVNGASGGVGTFAVQIAKSLGAEVTGVCSTKNVELVRSLGADHVVDYTKEDFTQSSQHYDVILDNVANHSASEYRRVLTPQGTVVIIGGGGPDAGNWVGPFVPIIKASLLKPFVSQKFVMIIADMNKDDLAAMADLMAAGKVTPVIDRRYPLNETAAALAYLEQGHARGKVIIDTDAAP